MVLDPIFQVYLAASPVCVMTRAILERALSGEALDALFARMSPLQYTRELLFSQVVELMGRVAFRQSPSVGASYKKLKEENRIHVSATAVFDKLSGLDPQVSAELVRQSSATLAPVLRDLNRNQPSLLPGLRLRIVDGNHFAATHHRLGVLRTVKNAPLPAQVVAIYEPALDLVTDLIPCEDAHAQERSMTPEILAAAQPNDCFVGDRNFCTKRLLFGLAVARQAFFAIRQHKTNCPGTLVGHRQYVGRTATGAVYEQQMRIEGDGVDDGRKLRVRRITLVLAKPTVDGETELHVLSNLPKSLASGLVLIELYRERWTIEAMFLTVTTSLRCEVETLGYPRAAIFAFCVALMGYHVLAVGRAAFRAEQGAANEKMLSDYYLAEEIAAITRGMLVMLPPEKWLPFHQCTPLEFATFLREAASHMRLSAYKKNVRGPKKPPPKRHIVGGGSHVATERLLRARRGTTNSP
jgi:hypothetical protein